MLKVTTNKNVNGTARYYILRQNRETKKWLRIPTSEIGTFTSKAEAEEWIKRQKEYEYTRRSITAKKEEWIKKSPEVVLYLPKFIAWHRTKAPNSAHQNKQYFRYLTEFFIGKHALYSPAQWAPLRGKFKRWLETDARGSRDNGILAYSTKNGVIKCYNNFMKYMAEVEEMHEDFALPIACFGQHLVNKRGAEDVIKKDEYLRVREVLLASDPLVAAFFTIAWNTGMRFAEILGLPLEFIYQGDLDGPLGDEMRKHYDIYGYIVLESQLKEDYIKRIGNEVERKPLKSKKRIEPKNNRVIPITDENAWETIAELAEHQQSLLDDQEFGLERLNYLLFDGLNMSRANRALSDAYTQLGIARKKSFHCCRHSKCTYLIGETRSYFIGRSILGNKGDVFDDYCHIYDFIANSAKTDKRLIRSKKSQLKAM